MFVSRWRPAALGALLGAALLLPANLQAAPSGQTTPPPVPSGCGVSPGGPGMLDPSSTPNITRTPFLGVTGVPFSVTLDSNRTTGYSWILGEPLDTTMLQLDSHIYNRPSATVPGAGGTETWTFTPLCAGATTLVLVYRRPWEPPSPTDRQQIYDIVVQ